jgi:hypothetical protein
MRNKAIVRRQFRSVHKVCRRGLGGSDIATTKADPITGRLVGGCLHPLVSSMFASQSH